MRGQYGGLVEPMSWGLCLGLDFRAGEGDLIGIQGLRRL